MQKPHPLLERELLEQRRHHEERYLHHSRQLAGIFDRLLGVYEERLRAEPSIGLYDNVIASIGRELDRIPELRLSPAEAQSRRKWLIKKRDEHVKLRAQHHSELGL